MTDQTTKNQTTKHSPEKNDDQINFVVKRKLEGKELREAIKKQIEYYFSRENLSQDAYLVSQMDRDMLVPLSVVANFKMVKMLTNDIQLIVDVMKDSKNVILNEKKDKIGPSFKLKKNVIILRDIPKTTDKELVKNLFVPVATPTELRPDVGDTWFITFATDEDAEKSLTHVRTQTFNGSPVKARLKSETLLKSIIHTPNSFAHFRTMGNPYAQMPPYQPTQQWDQQQQIPFDPNWSGRGRRGGYRGGNRQQRRGGYQKRGQQQHNGTQQTDQQSGQQKDVTKGSKKGKENKRGKKGSREKHKQPVPNYGIKNFPPLPMGSKHDVDKPGYTGEFIKYTKQTVVEVVKSTMTNVQRPESLPKDCGCVLETPNTVLELTKPLPEHLANTISTQPEIKAPQPIKPAITPDTPTKSFVEAAITARDIKTPDVIVQKRKMSQKRKASIKGGKKNDQPSEQKKKDGKKPEKKNEAKQAPETGQQPAPEGDKSKQFQTKKKNKRRRPRKYEKKVEENKAPLKQNEKQPEQKQAPAPADEQQPENRSTYASILTQNKTEAPSSEQNGKKIKPSETKTTTGTK